MKKITRYLITPAAILSTFVSSTILSSCASFVVDKEIKSHDEQGWQHAIEHMATCKHPTIFISATASYLIQQQLNMYFAASQLAIQKGNIYTNPEYKLNDFILLTNGDSWNAKENKQGEKTSYFNYDYSSCVNSKYNYSDILKNSAPQKEIDVTKGNQLVISNLQDFDLSLSTYDKTKNDYMPFREWKSYLEFDSKPYCRILNKIIDIYEQQNPDIKLNFVVKDSIWDYIFSHKSTSSEIFSEDQEMKRLLVRILKHLDKMYFISDGSYTWTKGYWVYKKYFERNGYTSAKDQSGIIHLMQTLSEEQAIQYLKYVDPFVFYNNEKYFVHFCPKTKSYESSRVLNPSKHLTKDTTCKYAGSLLVPNSYKTIVSDVAAFNNFESSYLQLFNALDNSGQIQKFEKYIIDDTYKNFKPYPQKKNLIFIVPGALRGSKKPSEDLWSECRSIMDKIKEKYPSENWNYLYKFHPAADENDIKTTLKKLFNLSEGEPWPDNTVILNKVYPFEFLVALDQHLVNTGIETNYHMIQPDTFNEEKPSGILTGFDICSTCFFAAIAMMVNEYNISFDKAKKLIQSDAFYITRKFSFADYKSPDGKDYGPFNKKMLEDTYRVLIDVNEFPDINMFKYN